MIGMATWVAPTLAARIDPHYSDNVIRCRPGESAMRWFHLTVVIVFVAALVIFALQNFETITISFMRSSLQLPMAVLVVLAYLLGMATGGSVWALLRYSLQGSRRID